VDKKLSSDLRWLYFYASVACVATFSLMLATFFFLGTFEMSLGEFNAFCYKNLMVVASLYLIISICLTTIFVFLYRSMQKYFPYSLKEEKKTLITLLIAFTTSWSLHACFMFLMGFY